MTVLSTGLWSKQLAHDLAQSDAVVKALRDTTVLQRLPQRKYDPYRTERALLRRINRCKTELGKLKALERALEAERDY